MAIGGRPFNDEMILRVAISSTIFSIPYAMDRLVLGGMVRHRTMVTRLVHYSITGGERLAKQMIQILQPYRCRPDWCKRHLPWKCPDSAGEYHSFICQHINPTVMNWKGWDWCPQVVTWWNQEQHEMERKTCGSVAVSAAFVQRHDIARVHAGRTQ